MSLWRGTVCTNCEKEHECAEAELMFEGGAIAYGCSACVPKPQTNYDRLISKTPEELAEWVTTKGRTFGEDYEGYMSLLDWLNDPAEEGEE